MFKDVNELGLIAFNDNAASDASQVASSQTLQ